MTAPSPRRRQPSIRRPRRCGCFRNTAQRCIASAAACCATPGMPRTSCRRRFSNCSITCSTAATRRNLKSWLFTVAANACRDRTRWRLRWLPWNAERDDRPVDPTKRGPAEAGHDGVGAREAFRVARAARSAAALAARAGTFIQRDCRRVRDPRAVGRPSAGARPGAVEETMRCLTDVEVQAVVDDEASEEYRAHADDLRACRARVDERRDQMETIASLIDADGMPSSMLETRLRQAMSDGLSQRTGPTNDVRGSTVLRATEPVAVACSASSPRWRPRPSSRCSSTACCRDLAHRRRCRRARS